MGSGPARALARVEPLFETLAYRDTASSAVLVLETARAAAAGGGGEGRQGATGLPAEKLTFLYAPTQSLAGTVQIVSRVLEVALHKANDLKFPLENIVDGMAAAPIPRRIRISSPPWAAPTTPSSMAASSQLFVRGKREDARALAEKLPSRASRDYGQPFAEIFKRVQGRFLCHRSAAVQPGRGHRDGDRNAATHSAPAAAT